MIRSLPSSTLFPYTTLFRSGRGVHALPLHRPVEEGRREPDRRGAEARDVVEVGVQPGQVTTMVEALVGRRSEEHTSELQSRPHLVCRLLLEKKKEKIRINIS